MTALTIDPNNWARYKMITTQDSNRLMLEEDWDCGCVVEDCELFATDFIEGHIEGHPFADRTVCDTHAPDICKYTGSYGLRENGTIYRKGKTQ
jgi:hypothetical protein